MDVETFKISFKKKSKILLVFEVLEDRDWHCRECEYTHTKTTQIAGGSGIQGLRRGGSNRSGIELKSQNNFCKICKRTTRQDMWTGQFIEQKSSHQLNKTMASKILMYYKHKDVVEQTTRTAKELTIDHRFPMIRWTPEYGNADKQNMNEVEISKRFQLLKKSNGSASHNLLKSRACENCLKCGTRGTPFGIEYYYEGDKKWNGVTENDENGCHGCGWYDFGKWRKSLNMFIKKLKHSS